MVGLFITILASMCWAGLGRWFFRRWLADFGPAADLGISGLFGLGLVGTITLFTGLLSTQLALIVGLVLALVGAVGFWQAGPLRPEWPKGLEWVFFCACLLAMIFAAVGVLAPSNMLDWDTLAYHLAVPKLWIQAGHIYSVPFIHHSNFPQAIDNLYLFGLQWGGQQGAKAFSLVFLVFGMKTAYGLAKLEYGGLAGWWAALGIASVPLIVWEAGTAYIDVGHGLFAGLGLYFAAKLLANTGEKRYFWLAVIFLSFAAGSKYTGLQAIFACSAVVGLGGIALRSAGKGIGTALALGGLAVILASPWYVRNVVWKGNPVFPFFYSKLGGEEWDQQRADIYTHEQNTFGVGRTPADAQHPDVANNRLDPSRVGHAILGLAYQPGRYVNPGQTDGEGTPLGAFGAALLAAMMLWLFSGRARALEHGMLGGSLITLFMWFALSEQSRYVLALALPLSVLLGGGVVRIRAGPILGVLTGLQAVYCLWLIDTQLAVNEMPVALGMVPADDYQQRTIPFYDGAQAINKLGPESKTALYDEVFGYLLDVPYFWANPGHTTIIPHGEMWDGGDYAYGMMKLGFTHVYINMRPMGEENMKLWFDSAGFGPKPGAPDEATFGLLPKPYPKDKPQFETRYQYLTADAVAKWYLVPVAGNGRWFLFKLQPHRGKGLILPMPFEAKP